MPQSQLCFVGIGSNIRPKTNVPLIVDALLQQASVVHISRIVETEAVEMLDNSQSFFNLTAAFESTLDAAARKIWFREIETALGRDRNHPLSKMRGRPADIDEIELPGGPISLADLPPEPHIRPMLIELLDYLNVAHFDNPALGVGQTLKLHNQLIGQQAMTLSAK